MSRLAIFDCDGTMVDGQASICEAMEAAFAASNLLAPDRHNIRRIVGLSLPQAVRLLAPDSAPAIQAHIVQSYKDAYRASREEGRLTEPLFEGMEALLRQLKNAGWKLAVATGKSDRGLTNCLANHGIIDLFVSLQTADRHPSKPHPAMLEAVLFEAGAQVDDAVMIGDTSFDMEMARTINMPAIGVNWGYHTQEELLDSGAQAVAHTMQELAEMLL